jgi:hypothetical protein
MPELLPAKEREDRIAGGGELLTARREGRVRGGEDATGWGAPGLTEIITRLLGWPHRGARRTTLRPRTVVPANAPRQVAQGRRQGRAPGHR